MTRRPGPRVLRWLAALLIGGPEAAYIRVDFEDAFDHDVSRGLPVWRVWWRYAVNVLASACSGWGARLRPSGLGVSWVDVRLGTRMLRRYPGLTCVAVFALGIGIPIGLAPAQFLSAIEAPLPVDEGDRIQMLRYWNTASLRPDSTTVSDFRRWSETLTSFETLGASRMASYNIGSTTRDSSTVAGAAVTASMFDILPTRLRWTKRRRS